MPGTFPSPETSSPDTRVDDGAATAAARDAVESTPSPSSFCRLLDVPLEVPAAVRDGTILRGNVGIELALTNNTPPTSTSGESTSPSTLSPSSSSSPLLSFPSSPSSRKSHYRPAPSSAVLDATRLDALPRRLDSMTSGVAARYSNSGAVEAGLNGWRRPGPRNSILHHGELLPTVYLYL